MGRGNSAESLGRVPLLRRLAHYRERLHLDAALRPIPFIPLTGRAPRLRPGRLVRHRSEATWPDPVDQPPPDRYSRLLRGSADSRTDRTRPGAKCRCRSLHEPGHCRDTNAQRQALQSGHPPIRPRQHDRQRDALGHRAGTYGASRCGPGEPDRRHPRSRKSRHVRRRRLSLPGAGSHGKRPWRRALRHPDPRRHPFIRLPARPGRDRPHRSLGCESQQLAEPLHARARGNLALRRARRTSCRLRPAHRKSHPHRAPSGRGHRSRCRALPLGVG